MVLTIDQAMRFSELVRQKVGDLTSLAMGLYPAIVALDLDFEQFVAFCEASPDGRELLLAFMARRDSANKPDSYSFQLYIMETLAGTGHPVQP